ncbi:MAG: magnesium transporter, partial [Firmicutes bacterium]|nr:magnesium transporter [Bacillota bacterium]
AGVATLLWQGNIYLGIVVGFSMLLTVILATVIGTLVPLLCHKMGIDPAITSGPFVTTIKDVTGLLIYFGMATIFFRFIQ